MENENLENKSEECHNELSGHEHVMKRLDGKYSVIKEIDKDNVEEIAVYDTEEEAKSNVKTLEEEVKTEEVAEVPTEVAETPTDKVEITDDIDIEDSDPEEVEKFEEELKK